MSRRNKRINNPTIEPTMSDFEDIKKSLWHAFQVLDQSLCVNKSRVRVLTNNLGHVMGLDQAETVWDKVEDDVIDFDLFVKTLRANLLVGIHKTNDPHCATLRAELDNLCWMLCEKSYLNRIYVCNNEIDSRSENVEENHKDKEQEKKKRKLGGTDLFKMWKIFNFLCERSDDQSVLIPLRVDIEEADRIACEICNALGLTAPVVMPRSPREEDTSFLLDFCQFVNHVISLIDDEEPDEVISHGISETHAQIISDIIRKGHMIKFGNKVTAWKERWFVLTASTIRYYVSAEEKDLKGSMVFNHECFTQSFPDKPGGKHHRFKLHTANKQYELSAPDLKTKNMWMADIKRVVSHIGKKESLQLMAWKERKREREDRRRRTAEEEMRRCAVKQALAEREQQLEELKKQREQDQAEKEERERLLEIERKSRQEEEEKKQRELDALLAQKRLEIEAERQRCVEIESRLNAEREDLLKTNQEALDAERNEREEMMEKLKQEEAVLEAEKNSLKERLKELEEAKQMLEKAVEDERALKRDEEIVRNLQAKTLQDEFAKRAELERLRDEQRQQLMKEQLSRQELQEAHERQENELMEKHTQLEALIKEREEADKKWKDASERLKVAETDRQRMEERLKLKEMSSSINLAKPLSTPNPNPFVTHRGLGAFSEADFVTKGLKNGHHINNNIDVLNEDGGKDVCKIMEVLDITEEELCHR